MTTPSPIRRTGTAARGTGAAAGFTQAGRSPFVSHVRSDAEKGARGILEVLP